jgi:hypothetical protein
MNIFFKSLAGDIFTISIPNSNTQFHSSFEKSIERWNNIRKLLSEQIECDLSQIVILDENQDIPEIIPDQVYPFFIREKNYVRDNLHVSLKALETYECGDDLFHKYTVQLYDKNELDQEFYFYYDKPSNKFYHKDSIISSGIDRTISLRLLASDSSLYDILYKNLSIPWYDKDEIIHRINTQVYYISNWCRDYQYHINNDDNYDY